MAIKTAGALVAAASRRTLQATHFWAPFPLGLSRCSKIYMPRKSAARQAPATMRALITLLAMGHAAAWVLPGTAAQQYQAGEKVELKVKQLTSPKTHLGYDAYSMKTCRPAGGIVPAAENLGEHLTGETIENSAYDIYMRVNETCKKLCAVELSAEDIDLFVKRIDEDYNANWMVDNLPAATTGLLVGGAPLYARGIPIGGIEEGGRYFIYNHHKLVVRYHNDPSYEGSRVVGFDVEPVSVAQAADVDPATCVNDGVVGITPNNLPRAIIREPAGAATTVAVPYALAYSFDIGWAPSDIQWASRWDIYLSMGNLYNDNVHWFSIINSMIISVFLTGMVAMILVRALRADISRYNRELTEEEKIEEREETGWKLVHGDAFRPPARNPTLFAVFAGIGTQLIGMAGVTIIFAAIGFLSPANRGSLMIALLLTFLLMGVVAGYTTARLYKLFNGARWQRVTLFAALGFPGFIFSVLFILNLFVWYAKSTNAVRFTSMFAVLCLWLLISVPLVFFGAYHGFRADKIELPVRVALLPRQVPEQPWYLQTFFCMLVGGILPFGTIFVELFFILTSLWLDQYYYVFGFLLLVYALLLITCAEISIVLTYFQLCAEDYRWWWRSMLAPGASGIYLYAYCIFYYMANLEVTGWVSQLLYFGYMGLAACVFTFITGAMGFLATFWFVRTIYSAIKVD